MRCVRNVAARLRGTAARWRLRERWGGRKKEPFTGESWHVSVYQRG